MQEKLRIQKELGAKFMKVWEGKIDLSLSGLQSLASDFMSKGLSGSLKGRIKSGVKETVSMLLVEVKKNIHKEIEDTKKFMDTQQAVMIGQMDQILADEVTGNLTAIQKSTENDLRSKITALEIVFNKDIKNKYFKRILMRADHGRLLWSWWNPFDIVKTVFDAGVNAAKAVVQTVQAAATYIKTAWTAATNPQKFIRETIIPNMKMVLAEGSQYSHTAVANLGQFLIERGKVFNRDVFPVLKKDFTDLMNEEEKHCNATLEEAMKGAQGRLNSQLDKLM